MTRSGSHGLRNGTGSHTIRRGTRRHRHDPLGLRHGPLGVRQFLTPRHLTRHHRGLTRDPGLRGLPGGLSRPVVLVRPGRSHRRQREHRARGGLLRRRPLVRG
ncbi:hypothetical protein, partial [Streptomyces griseorubens]|uniref:hypothetical protein n=1 Tax=Streptomyces griseorubens TaxID=66897 RepID=UPI001AD80357